MTSTKKIIVVNAGPRKGWNTDTLLNEAAKGAEEAGASVIHFDLFKLERYTGCISCFGCKKSLKVIVSAVTALHLFLMPSENQTVSLSDLLTTFPSLPHLSEPCMSALSSKTSHITLITPVAMTGRSRSC